MVFVIWNANAEFRDPRMGEGNDFHKILIEPARLRLLNLKAGEKILDIACGNGQFAPKMAGSGSRVTAVDFSDKFIQIARSKGRYDFDYQVIDAAGEIDLAKLKGGDLDSIV
jgi:2-polyprenyl-3-methyl-5-hydroxy-6-metoxy-1,4-benzoquinol methylase